MEKAKSIALKDAGFDREEVFFVKTRSDWNNGQLVYEVDFVKGSTKYEYEIRAKDGVILDRDKETWTENGSYIGLEKAKSIALKDAASPPGRSLSSRLSRTGMTAYEVRSGVREGRYRVRV